MAYGKKLLFEQMRTETAAVVNDGASGNYIAIGVTAGNQVILHPVRMMKIDNTTDVLLTFTTNINQDEFILPASSSVIMDLSTNRVMDGSFFLAKGEILYAKGAPTTGDVYFTVIYAKGD